MHGSLAKLGNPNDAGQASAIAVYYTRGSEARLLEASTSFRRGERRASEANERRDGVGRTLRNIGVRHK